MTRPPLRTGQRVKRLVHGFEYARPRVERGVVTGFGREAWLVLVHVDGVRTEAIYHADTWEPDEETSLTATGAQP